MEENRAGQVAGKGAAGCMQSAVWSLVILAALFAAVLLALSWFSPNSTAMTTTALAVVAIPYAIARAISEISKL